tara:strand:+ start:3668 stop:4765 length:1098 start_codon:yes stop_codon:yes gene_type:complete
MAKTKDELQAEALHAIGKQSDVSVEIGTGGGKTLLGLKHMASNYNDSISYLVAAPKLSIQKEWINQATQHGYDYLISSIVFTTYRSLVKQDLRHDWLYLDECHSLKYSHTEWLDCYLTTGGKILGLTGTYPKYKSSEKAEMCNNYCRKIFEYDVDNAIEDGLLNDYKIYIHLLKLGTGHTVIKKGKQGKVWKTSEQKDYAYYCNALTVASGKSSQILRIMRMKAIQGYPSKLEYVKQILKKIDSKTLIFANTKAQADEICPHSYHSSNKNSEENLQLFADDKIYRLSCVEQLSEGKNINNLRTGIIMHAYSNEVKTRQKIGRFLRLNPNQTATVHILCYENSVDFEWVSKALQSFDKNKIKFYRP